MSRNMSASNGDSSSELAIGLPAGGPMTDNDVRTAKRVGQPSWAGYAVYMHMSNRVERLPTAERNT